MRSLVLIGLGLALILAVQGCVYRGESISPTGIVDATQALQTVQALLTSTSPAETLASSSTPGGPETASPDTKASATVQATRTPAGSPTPTGVCDRAAAGSPIDVTIPDDTVLQPGQAFTKIWKLENAGSCTWSKDYAAVFFYGDGMGAAEVIPIPSYVEPGEPVEIAIEMVAPGLPGAYQGNWKLRNAEGALFGIGPAGDSPFWVRVIVQESANGDSTPTGNPTLMPTSTEILPTPLPSPTYPVAVQSQLGLETDYLLDLDLAQVNPSEGSDLAYRTGSMGYHWLIPQGEAVLGVFGNQQPGLQDCQTANMSAAPIPIESLPNGIYLCYQTIQGQIGWMQLLKFDSHTFSIWLAMLTWTT
jgi:hypothetical protein